jgi:hypothetical protein
MIGRNPDWQIVTIIVTKQGLGAATRVWLTFDGGWRSTFVMDTQQIDELTRLLKAARDASGVPASGDTPVGCGSAGGG